MSFGQWLGLITLIFSLYILWQVRQLLLLLFVAIVFATALNRLVRQWQQNGVGRGVAAAISVIGVLAILSLFMALIVPSFLDQFQEITLLIPEALNLLEGWIDGLLARLPGETSAYIPDIGDLVNQIQPLVRGLANNVFRIFSGVINLTGGILFVAIFTLMLLLDPHSYRRGFIRLIPSFYRQRADQILSLCEADLVNWIIGTLFNMVVIGLVSGIVLWALGVRLVLANALLAGLMEAIPIIGPFLSTIAPTAIALLDSPIKAIAVIIAYILIQQLEQFFLVPYVMGQQVALLPAVTLLAQVTFASFFGVLGLFLAIPLVIIVRLLLHEILIKDVLDQWQFSSVANSLTRNNLEVNNIEVNNIPVAANSSPLVEQSHQDPSILQAEQLPDQLPDHSPNQPSDSEAEMPFQTENKDSSPHS